MGAADTAKVGPRSPSAHCPICGGSMPAACKGDRTKCPFYGVEPPPDCDNCGMEPWFDLEAEEWVVYCPNCR